MNFELILKNFKQLLTDIQNANGVSPYKLRA